LRLGAPAWSQRMAPRFFHASRARVDAGPWPTKVSRARMGAGDGGGQGGSFRRGAIRRPCLSGDNLPAPVKIRLPLGTLRLRIGGSRRGYPCTGGFATETRAASLPRASLARRPSGVSLGNLGSGQSHARRLRHRRNGQHAHEKDQSSEEPCPCSRALIVRRQGRLLNIVVFAGSPYTQQREALGWTGMGL
jgi:hypothetical protein